MTNPKPTVLPELREWTGHEGFFAVNAASKIWLDPALPANYLGMARIFAEDFRAIAGGIAVETGNTPVPGDFTFAPSKEVLAKEGYHLTIGDSVFIEAGDYTGAFWATRTILQILKQTGGTIPRGVAKDYPKYRVRGFHLDVGRKAVPLAFLRMWVKQMAWYKLNDFNVHLSDECFDLNYFGFRLESDVPGLTSTDVFYTKDEFRAFIEESAARGVRVVPEFDTPGHAMAYTHARPDLARPEKPHYHEHKNYLDVTNPNALAFMKELFAEYMAGENPVFPKGGVVHIGTDEYKGAADQSEKEAFRKYQDALLKFIRDDMGRTPRVWGSQTENSGETPITAKGVQMHMWNADYANPREMYELGYEMINIHEHAAYIVPGAEYYQDYLDKHRLLHEWEPCDMLGLRLSPEDPQVLGGAYALWNDKTGALDNGASDAELFDRMFDALPCFSQRLWSDCKDYDVPAIDELSRAIRFAPGTNPTCELPEGFALDLGHIKLTGGACYVETPAENAGVGYTLEFNVKRDPASGESPQVLFESDSGQIMAVQGGAGSLGFSRDFRCHAFDYILPKGEWVRIALETQLSKTTLYVNGEKLQTLEGGWEFGEDGRPVCVSKWASLVIPLRRVGSKTNAFVGEITDIKIHKNNP